MNESWQAAAERAREAVHQHPAGHLDLSPRRTLHEAMLATLGLEAQHDFILVAGLRTLDAALQHPTILTDEQPRQDLLVALRILLRVADRRMAATTARRYADQIKSHALDWMGRGDPQQFAMRVAYRTLLAIPTTDAPPEERATDQAWDSEAWDLPFCASVVMSGGLPWTTTSAHAVEARKQYWLGYLALASEAEGLDWVDVARSMARKHKLDADRTPYKGGMTFDSDGTEHFFVLDADTSATICEVPVCDLRGDAVVIEVEKLTRNLDNAELTEALKAALLNDLLREDFAEPYATIRVTNRDSGTSWEQSS